MSIKQSLKDQLAKWPSLYESVRWLYCMVFKGGNYKESAASRANRLLASCDNVMFLQVGANDGLRCDPINVLAKRNSTWRGVLVEPVDFVFERLVANYRHSRRFQYVNKAVGEKRERKPFYHLSSKSESAQSEQLPFWYDQISSFDKSHILKLLGPTVEPQIRTVFLDVVPLQSILDECHVERLDVLHTDVEGYDWQVVKQLDLVKYRPAVILFENKHVSDVDLDEAKNTLSRAGYELYSDATDTLCVHPQAFCLLKKSTRQATAA